VSRILVLMVLVGCGPWAKTQRLNTASGYAEFRTTYPTSPKVAVAVRKEEALRWTQARTEQDAASFRAYLHAHPQGEHVEEARGALDHALYREAKDRRAFQSYLVYQPEGAHVDEAKAALESLDWSDARAVGTSEAYGSYLLHHPEGAHVEEATALRDEGIWTEARQRDSVFGYRRYLDQQRRGAHRDEAEARIEALTFVRAKIALRSRSTWRGDGNALATELAAEVRRDWVIRLYALGFETPIEVMTADLTGVPSPMHPLDQWPIDVGTALFVVDLDERRGRRLEPYYGTVLKGSVTLYAAGKREPLSSGWVEARTSAYVERGSQAQMHDDAEQRLAEILWSAVRADEFLREGVEPPSRLPELEPRPTASGAVKRSGKKSLSERLPR
jgi:hypothetical protein